MTSNFDYVKSHTLKCVCAIIGFFLLFAGCKHDDEYKNFYTDENKWTNIERTLQTQIIMAKDGDTIFLKPGHFWFTRSVIIDDKKNVTLSGAGMDKTFLSFKGQEEGAEGIKIANCQGFTLMDLTILDSHGDNIKASNTVGIRFLNIKSDWTNGAKESNGAYAIYPVLCKNVLIEKCIAARASDAGIYVGQSDTVIVKDNIAYQNVAGIESENCKYVDIYNNKAFDNSGGILVFDLPGLTQYGRTTRVFDNEITKNNHSNFAPKGNIVGMVPPGTGIMLLSTREVQIFDNQIIDNKTSGTAIVSYELVTQMDKNKKSNHNQKNQLDPLYNPYPDSIFIYNNVYKNSHWIPDLSNDIGKLTAWKFLFNTPFILWDGFVKNKDIDIKMCIKQGDISFANVNAPQDLNDMKTDVNVYNCTSEKYNPVQLRFRNEIFTSQKK